MSLCNSVSQSSLEVVLCVCEWVDSVQFDMKKVTSAVLTVLILVGVEKCLNHRLCRVLKPFSAQHHWAISWYLLPLYKRVCVRMMQSLTLWFHNTVSLDSCECWTPANTLLRQIRQTPPFPGFLSLSSQSYFSSFLLHSCSIYLLQSSHLSINSCSEVSFPFSKTPFSPQFLPFYFLSFPYACEGRLHTHVHLTHTAEND